MAAASHTACPAEILSPQPSIAVAGAPPNENGVSPRLAETQQLVAEVVGVPRGTTGAGRVNVVSALALPVSPCQPRTPPLAVALRPSSSSGSVSAHAASALRVSRDRSHALDQLFIQVCEELAEVDHVKHDLDLARVELMQSNKKLANERENRDHLLEEANERLRIERLAHADREERTASAADRHAQEIASLNAVVDELRQQSVREVQTPSAMEADPGASERCVQGLTIALASQKTRRDKERQTARDAAFTVARFRGEVSTASTALAEHMRERDVRQLKVAELNEAATHTTKQHDDLKQAFTAELCAATNRIDELERCLIFEQSEKERSHDAHASALEALRTERDQSRRDADDKQHLEAALHDTHAVTGNALRRQTSPSRRSAGQPRADAAPEAPVAAPPSSTHASPRTSLSPVPGGGSHKRARIENMRFVAVDLSDGQELARALKNMPGVTVVECQPNMPVPPNLTHLIADGASTVELMAALASGCWVLPRRYVLDSVAHGAWLPEAEYGIRHAQPPLRNKRVVMTDHFRLLESCDDVVLLLRAGGAIVGMDPNEADIVLCRSSELASVRHGMNWEGLIQLIYPVKITTEP